ncbi:MAG: polysaccharide deacetylase family protein [Myxococcales bacterium]|nr:polysaccharide deacetylase family protein [Myxococcales bacterium]
MLFTVIGLFCFALPLVAGGAWVLWLLRQEHRTPRVPILMYHRFLDAKKVASGELVDPERVWVALDSELDEHCAALAKAGYTAIDFDELLEVFAGKRTIDDKAVVLTFDDGYTSCWDLARPVLKRHGMKGVFYICLTPDDHSRELVKGIDDFMTPEQLRGMHELGHTIGSHTMSHGLLSEMTDDEVRWELTESKAQLEKHIGAPVDHFCIPRAGGDKRVIRMIGEAGYTTSTGADKGGAHPGCHPLRLPRIGVSRGTSGEALLARLHPLRAAKERMLSDIRLIPTRVMGPRVGYELRKVLYGGPIRRALLQEHLMKLILLAGVGYVGLGVFWLMHTFQ